MDETMTAPSDNTREKVAVFIRASHGDRPIKSATAAKEHITTVFTIFADGTHGKSSLIFPRKTLPKLAPELMEHFAIGGSTKGWMNKQIFHSWVTEVFIPEIEHRREIDEAPDQRALLILDSHSSRQCAKALSALSDADIDVVTIPSHSSHIVQPLDLLVNGQYKKALAANIDVQEDATSEERLEAFVRGALYAMTEALLPRLVKQSFALAGVWPLNEEQGVKSKYVTKVVDSKKKRKRTCRISIDNRLITRGSLIERLEDREEEIQAKARKKKKVIASDDDVDDSGTEEEPMP